jgi:Cellulase (glycosyl hydrolase family 5)
MPVRRILTVLAALSLAAAVAAPLGGSAPRMWVGFHDDPSFRWEGDRGATLDRVRAANATLVRAVVTWAQVAPERPANATDPFDPAYRLDDLDELVRGAQQRGLEVLLSIWGTPRWANGGKTPNVMPTRLADLRDFSQALASRYSGRNSGYPFVRFWSVWNESNLQLFLTPQFDARRKIVGPRNYAKLYAAAYAGIKAGNPRALVGIGETSSHGRDRKLPGNSDTIAPATFARLVAAANPRLKFDAWAHHPYPVPVNMKPTQKVRWPNVALTSLPQFEQSLDKWFKRRGIRIWITEYGHETRPAEPAGVTLAQQASYVRQAMTMLRADARVQMFVWFIWQDSRTSLWQSGMLGLTGATKPALSRYTAEARKVDARNPLMQSKAGLRTIPVRLPLREFCVTNPVGSPIGATVRVRTGSSLVAVSQPLLTLGSDCTGTTTIQVRVAAKKTYIATFDLNDDSGLTAQRTATIVGR